MRFPFLRRTPGPSPSDPILTALREQNHLLRALLEHQGVHVDPVPQTKPPPRRATEKDITILTREDLLASQLQEELSVDERQAREARSSGSPDNPLPKAVAPAPIGEV